MNYDGNTYLVFCFNSCEAAEQFCSRWNGQFIDHHEVDKEGRWTPREPVSIGLYRMASNQSEIRSMTQATLDSTGNLEADVEIRPDDMAPIVRNTPAGRELAFARWGVPSPPKPTAQIKRKGVPTRAEKLKAELLLKMESDLGVSTIRNAEGKHWRRWHGVEFRCVIPFTAFAMSGDPVSSCWLAADPSRPLMFFAGFWVPRWESVRKRDEGQTINDVFGFLSTEPSGVVAPIRPRAMPVILANAKEVEMWLTEPWSKVRRLQRPLPDDQLVLLSPEEVIR